MEVRLSKTFLVTGCADLDAHTDDVMYELVKLEEADSRLSDCDLDATLARGIVTLNVSATGDSVNEARELADSAMRTAIHAAGAATPGWTTAENSSEESVEYLLTDEHLIPA